MSQRPIRLPFVTAVAGVSHRQAVLRDIVEGDVLDVVAVDDNPHDADAVEVRTSDGELAGFIPAAIAGRLRATGERRWSARVDAVLRRQTWGLRINVGADTASTGDPGDPGVSYDDTPPLGEPPAGDREPAAVAPGRPCPLVRAASGRVLGELVRIDGSKVTVKSPTGSEMQYPASVVVIGDAA